MNDYYKNSLAVLRKLVGDSVDFDAIINKQLDIDNLNELLAPYAEELRFRFPLQNPGIKQLSDLLCWASKKGHMELARLLLAHGANINWSTGPLRLASESNHVELVRLLLVNGADVHDSKDMPLREASYFGNVAAVELLLAYGANVHAEDDIALGMASSKRHVEVVKILLDHGASPRVEWVQHFERSGDYEIANLLKAKLDQSKP
jgi:ankyrin repeat protein